MSRLSNRLLYALSFARGYSKGVRGSRVGRRALVVLRNGELRGKSFVLGNDVRIAVVGDVDRAVLSIGSGTSIGDRAVINVACRVTIGSDTQMSWDCQILDTDFHMVKYRDGSTSAGAEAVTIGDHVLIGTGVIILKGVEIGDNVVIGAGSVVSRSIPAGWLVAGNPARHIREVEAWT